MATVTLLQTWDGIEPRPASTRPRSARPSAGTATGRRHVLSLVRVPRMTHVWDSEELFGTFVQTLILPGLRQLGSPASPTCITQAAHEVTTVDGT